MGLPNKYSWDTQDRSAQERSRSSIQQSSLRLVERREGIRVPTFAPIEAKKNWRSFFTATGMHVVAIVLLALVPFLITDTIPLKQYYAVLLEPPPSVRPPEPEPVKLPPPPPLPRLKPPPPVKEKLEIPRPPEIKPVETPPPPKPQPEPPKVAKAEPPKPVFESVTPGEGGPKGPKPAVRTDVFSGSSAKPTLNLPAREVQTGGFGDPNGVKPGKGDPNKGVQIATVGSFELPSGPGYGNGSGGARGARGTVASAGFGNGIATDGGGGGDGGRGRGGVRSGGFGDATQPVAQAPRAAQRASESPTKPVQILFKPKPVYTEEARRQRLEGEVLLEVEFLASGQVRVVRVKRGLGHGLDEAAMRAAQQIRFKPAERDGAPVNSLATVHILFQMAY